MGAEQFWTVGFGKTAKDAFQIAREEAAFSYGHSGYTGSIAEKNNYIMIPLPKGKNANDYIDELFEKEDPVLMTMGSCRLIDITKEVKKDYKAKKKRWPRGKSAFLFFGWASS
jgi:hypothetical protein